jgi:CspA family cold shock protein
MPVTGRVKWFSNAKGYGFIEQEGGQDVFVHYSSITSEGYRSLEEGQLVAFDIIQSEKGPQATNVTKQQEEASAVQAADEKAGKETASGNKGK